MRLVLTSDTHGFHRGWGEFGNPVVPGGDVLVHAGDFSRDFGSWTDAVRFARWMGELPHRHKILCPGNHDFALQERPREAEALFREHGVRMIGGSVDVFELDGITFGGGPWMPLTRYDPSWGYETPDDERAVLWGRVKKVDVLVSHTPPYKILDQTSQGAHLGCDILRREVLGRLRPRVHVFGHVHEGRGTWVEEGIVFVNASSNTRGTYVRDDVNRITHVTIGIRDPIVHDLEAR